MDIGLVLDEKLGHFLATEGARKHQRGPSILISQLKVRPEFDQAAHAREFVVLDGKGNGSPALSIDWVNLRPLPNHCQDTVKRAVHCGDMDRSSFVVLRCGYL